MPEIRYIRDIMNRNVVSMTPSRSVMEVAERMAAQRISCVVITERSRPVGILTERDLIKRVVTKGKDPHKTKLKDVMSKDPLTVTPETLIVHVARMMRKQKIRRFIVVEKGVLVGIITETDILNGLTDMIKHLNWKLVNTKIAMEEFIDHVRALLV